jgi:hypothetical protein
VIKASRNDVSPPLSQNEVLRPEGTANRSPATGWSHLNSPWLLPSCDEDRMKPYWRTAFIRTPILSVADRSRGLGVVVSDSAWLVGRGFFRSFGSRILRGIERKRRSGEFCGARSRHAAEGWIYVDAPLPKEPFGDVDTIPVLLAPGAELTRGHIQAPYARGPGLLRKQRYRRGQTRCNSCWPKPSPDCACER